MAAMLSHARPQHSDPRDARDPQEVAVRLLPVALLRPHEHNPRGPVDPATVADLADSIRQHGILEPLIVTPAGVVVAGHRRLAAAAVAGLREVSCVERDLSPTEQLEVMLTENIQRQNLSPLQEARGIRRLLDSGARLADVTRRIGLLPGAVKGRLAILDLPPAVQAYFDGAGGAGGSAVPLELAGILAGIGDPARQLELAEHVAEGRLGMAQVRALVANGAAVRAALAGGPRRRSASAEKPPWMTGDGPDRGAVVARLEATPGRMVTFGLLARVARGFCCACGLESVQLAGAERGAVCRSCPVPKLLHLTVKFGTKGTA